MLGKAGYSATKCLLVKQGFMVVLFMLSVWKGFSSVSFSKGERGGGGWV